MKSRLVVFEVLLSPATSARGYWCHMPEAQTAGQAGSLWVLLWEDLNKTEEAEPAQRHVMLPTFCFYFHLGRCG